MMRYIQYRKNGIYTYINEDWERDNQIWDWQFSWYQWNIISPKEEDDISYHEIHPKQKKWYIFIYMKIERETIQYEIGNFKISMKYYVAKRRNRYFISWDTSKTAKPIYIYIYMKMKIERETNKYEIGNSMISMKYYIAKSWRWYFISWNTFERKKKIIIYIYEDWER